MQTIYFDLDGTILDVSERIYRAYESILKKHKKKILPKDKYLKLKREKIAVEEILRRTRAENILFDYKKEWLRKIESKEYLRLDRVSQKRKEFLSSLKIEHNLVLITSRKKHKALLNQLHERGIYNIFSKVLVAKEGCEERKRTIKKHGVYKNSFLVGDTETDILTARSLGIKIISVYEGMRSKSFLNKFSPDFIFKDITLIKKTIFN